jgi:hypothetical protein
MLVSACIFHASSRVVGHELIFIYSAATCVCPSQVDKKFLRNQKFAKLNNKAQSQ